MLVSKNQQKSVMEVRLLESAVQLFSRHGFSKTGTREIAQLAEVNETTLFRYYGTKKELFWAALESRLERIKLGRELQSALASDHDPGVVVPMIFDFVTSIIHGQPELVRLLYVSGLELRGADEIYRKHFGAIFDSVSSYVKRSSQRGAICDIDPYIATLAFAGTAMVHSNLFELFMGHELPFANVQQASTAYSKFWLSMLGKTEALQPSVYP
jgi:AcrR family transcriptional regulator